jgi:hypothetical protein
MLRINRYIILPILLAGLTQLINASGEDSKEQARVLRVALRCDDVRFQGVESDGSAEYVVWPNIDIEYRPIDLSRSDNPRIRKIAVPICVEGDRLSFPEDGYRDFVMTDPEGLEVSSFVAEPAMSSATLMLSSWKKISCKFSNRYCVHLRKEGIYRFSIRVHLADDDGSTIEADVTGSFTIKSLFQGGASGAGLIEPIRGGQVSPFTSETPLTNAPSARPAGTK